MSKDPAVSWYWNDWAGGTQGMTREEKGAYMELLQAQHSRGSVPLAWIRRLFGDDFERLWVILKEKFQRDDDGFFNPRLREEISKRRAYSESRKKNRTKPKNEEENATASESPEVQKTYDKDMSNISKSYDEHMGIGIGNNNSTTEDSYNGSTALSIQGGAGGNGIAFNQSDELLFAEFLMAFGAAYVKPGKRGDIHQAAKDAVREIGGDKKIAMLQLCESAQFYVAWYRKTNPKDPPLKFMPEPQTFLMKGMYADDWKFKLQQLNSEKKDGKLPRFLTGSDKKP